MTTGVWIWTFFLDDFSELPPFLDLLLGQHHKVTSTPRLNAPDLRDLLGPILQLPFFPSAPGFCSRFPFSLRSWQARASVLAKSLMLLRFRFLPICVEPYPAVPVPFFPSVEVCGRSAGTEEALGWNSSLNRYHPFVMYVLPATSTSWCVYADLSDVVHFPPPLLFFWLVGDLLLGSFLFPPLFWDIFLGETVPRRRARLSSFFFLGERSFLLHLDFTNMG